MEKCEFCNKLLLTHILFLTVVLTEGTRLWANPNVVVSIDLFCSQIDRFRTMEFIFSLLCENCHVFLTANTREKHRL